MPKAIQLIGSYSATPVLLAHFVWLLYYIVD